MSHSSFASNLVRKSKQTLLSARVTLQIGDSYTAVSRSYYAMFDITRAALLSAGVPGNTLPRTHAGVIATFWKHAVETGKIDAGLAGSLSRAEALRIEADYTATEIAPGSAAAAVAQAETFVDIVERVFSLEESLYHSKAEDRTPGDDDKVSDAGVAKDSLLVSLDPAVKPYSIQEEQRQARENWLRYRSQQMVGPKEGHEQRDAHHGAAEDRGLSLDDSDE